MMRFAQMFDPVLLERYKGTAHTIKEHALMLNGVLDALEPQIGFKRTGHYDLDYWRAAVKPVATMPMTDKCEDWGIKPGPQIKEGQGRN